MSKKILILNGSPRAKGNTAALADAFTRGAESAGHTVTRFDVHTMNVHGCKSCFGGGKNPDSPCVQKDDMDKIYPVLKEADVLVLASPLYFWNVTAQLKSVLDRTFALLEGTPSPQMKYKECAMLIAAGDASDENFASVVSLYDNMLQYLGWKDLGKVLCGGVMAISDIEGKKELNDAEKLGASIV